jgi:hypothetical protein
LRQQVLKNPGVFFVAQILRGFRCNPLRTGFPVFAENLPVYGRRAAGNVRKLRFSGRQSLKNTKGPHDNPGGCLGRGFVCFPPAGF